MFNIFQLNKNVVRLHSKLYSICFSLKDVSCTIQNNNKKKIGIYVNGHFVIKTWEPVQHILVLNIYFLR